jgi:hypothetical protein
VVRSGVIVSTLHDSQTKFVIAKEKVKGETREKKKKKESER